MADCLEYNCRSAKFRLLLERYPGRIGGRGNLSSDTPATKSVPQDGYPHFRAHNQSVDTISRDKPGTP